MEFEFSSTGTTPPFFVAVHHVFSRATTRKSMASDFVMISWEPFIKSVFGHFQHDRLLISILTMATIQSTHQLLQHGYLTCAISLVLVPHPLYALAVNLELRMVDFSLF
jgi:hypothetical protein